MSADPLGTCAFLRDCVLGFVVGVVLLAIGLALAHAADVDPCIVDGVDGPRVCHLNPGDN